MFDDTQSPPHDVANLPPDHTLMEAQGKSRSILRDLALLYIAMAHSTDQDLSEPEVQTISERLRAWQTQATEETVLSAIKDALEDYTHERAHTEVERAVRRVRDELDSDLRHKIVGDLTEIALSDDKFLYAEGSFIGELARAWDVHVADEDVRPWSVLNGNDDGNGHSGWSPVHDLALVYFEIVHGTDADIRESEVDAIAAKIREWLPDADDADVQRVVREAMQAYVQGPDKRLFEDSVDALKKAVPHHQRSALLADLNFVARADGGVSESEQALIDKLSAAWGIEHSDVE